MDQHSIFLNQCRTLPDRAEQKSFGPFLKFRICAGAKTESFAYRFGKDNTSGFVDFHMHGINHGTCHF